MKLPHMKNSYTHASSIEWLCLAFSFINRQPDQPCSVHGPCSTLRWASAQVVHLPPTTTPALETTTRWYTDDANEDDANSRASCQRRCCDLAKPTCSSPDREYPRTWRKKGVVAWYRPERHPVLVFSCWGENSGSPVDSCINLQVKEGPETSFRCS